MPFMSGLDLLAELRNRFPALMVMIITGDGTVESAVAAMQLGALDYLRKPLSPQEVCIRVERALERYALTVENSALRTKLDDRRRHTSIVGASSAIRRTIDTIRLVAASDASVMICGESGTGKELVAREIHDKSERAGKPFVPVDCVAMPEQLIASELFGHEKGAFTGATDERVGLLDMGRGGTVFFDEITELDMDLQVKLLRVLQERQFRRIGGRKLLDLEVRILSATNRVPQQAVQDGVLRQDLYYRLNVIPIQVPPLRERREDIPLLVDHFLHVLSERHHRPMKQLTPPALELLRHHPWPGNVRELQNTVHRLFVLAAGESIQDVDVRAAMESQPATAQDSVRLLSLPLKEAKRQWAKQFEREYLVQLLAAHDHAIGRAATAAGVNRKTLSRLTEEHNIRLR
jgi:DNA-binding NtrC family response regulator